MKEITILVKGVGKGAELRTVPNELKILQALVGGYIECIPVGLGVSVLCDEEGRLTRKEYNCYFGGREFVGDICFVNSKGSEFASLTTKQIRYIKDMIGDGGNKMTIFSLFRVIYSDINDDGQEEKLSIS